MFSCNIASYQFSYTANKNKIEGGRSVVQSETFDTRWDSRHSFRIVQIKYQVCANIMCCNLRSHHGSQNKIESESVGICQIGSETQCFFFKEACIILKEFVKKLILQ